MNFYPKLSHLSPFINLFDFYISSMSQCMTKPTKMACGPREDSDQSGHLPSLIRVFAVYLKKAWVLNYPLSAQQRLSSDWQILRLIWVFAGCNFFGLVMGCLISYFQDYDWPMQGYIIPHAPKLQQHEKKNELSGCKFILLYYTPLDIRADYHAKLWLSRYYHYQRYPCRDTIKGLISQGITILSPSLNCKVF